MNKQNDPYKNNSYLKNDEEVLKEILFFKQFKIELQKQEPVKSKDDEEEYPLD